jgi:hypothetical protein
MCWWAVNAFIAHIVEDDCHYLLKVKCDLKDVLDIVNCISLKLR